MACHAIESDARNLVAIHAGHTDRATTALVPRVIEIADGFSLLSRLDGTPADGLGQPIRREVMYKAGALINSFHSQNAGELTEPDREAWLDRRIRSVCDSDMAAETAIRPWVEALVMTSPIARTHGDYWLGTS